MRKVNLIVVALAAIYLLAAPLALSQGKDGNAEGWDKCAPAVGESNWHLTYPGTTAFYVGGTVPDMHMHKYSFPWSLTRAQFHRKGRIALTSDCLLFAFEATSKDSFNLNENFGIRSCSNKISLSDDNAACSKPVTLPAGTAITINGMLYTWNGTSSAASNGGIYTPATGTHTTVGGITYTWNGTTWASDIKSYVIMIPYAKVNLLSRAKSSTSDLASISTAYATAAAGALAAIYDGTSSVPGVGAATGGLALIYYVFILKPRMGDNYIGVFVEPTVPRMTLSRDSNLVTATTTLPHYFRVGQQIEISGVENSPLVAIREISRDEEGKVTVITEGEHRLTVGAQLQVADVADPSFNGQFQVASPPANQVTFTYEQKDTPKAATSAGGRVQDVWNGTFVVESVDKPVRSRSFTYWQPGPNEGPTQRTGTAAVAVPVNTSLKVSGNVALDKTAKANFKSADLTGTATVAPPPGKSDELFKKGALLMFRIPNHHDYYNISMTLSAGTSLTFVSETAEKTGK